MSTGLCLAHAMLPKSIWLAKCGITTPWPICGRIQTLHLDNAKEFHGMMLDRACQNYGIELQWRPVKKPWYGGHMERWLGTFAQELQELPGATFSNPAERGEYDSEGQAALTLTEFERCLATFITEVYHQRVHSALGVAPIKYESSGPKNARWTVDERRLRLEFMPYLERTVQPYGPIDQIAYYSDVLRRWGSAADPEDPAHKVKFTVRRDPRDISVVHFWDPETQEYFRIPYRHCTPCDQLVGTQGNSPPASTTGTRVGQRRLDLLRIRPHARDRRRRSAYNQSGAPGPLERRDHRPRTSD
jgi:putative transposase